MIFEEWDILIVDDEPDVLATSKLAMKNIDVYGLPLKIHTATSKAEAIELLNNFDPTRSGFAVAFIDVVMESDQAGLELCQYIRQGIGNQSMQIYIRTGQPGIAPERTVIDDYDINGYFTKREMTEDKLYTLVKSGVRQYWWASSMVFVPTFITSNLSQGSREKIKEAYQQGLLATPSQKYGSLRAEVDGTILGLVNITAEAAAAKVAEMDEMPGTVLAKEGDKYVIDEEGHHFLRTVRRPGIAPVTFLFRSTFKNPEPAQHILYNTALMIGLIWDLAP
ncbi:MAG: response regulator [Chloroflexota bacterium]